MKLSPDDAQKTGQLRETLQLSRDVRKMYLIGLMSLDATGSKSDLKQYTTALEGLQKCCNETRQAYVTLKNSLIPERGESLEQLPILAILTLCRIWRTAGQEDSIKSPPHEMETPN